MEWIAAEIVSYLALAMCVAAIIAGVRSPNGGPKGSPGAVRVAREEVRKAA